MDISGWLSQSVTVLPRTGQSSTGAPTYGAPVVMPARVQPAQGLVRDRNGEEVVSSQVVYVASSIGPLDGIYLPGDNTADLTILKFPIRVDSSPDDTGATVYWKATL